MKNSASDFNNLYGCLAASFIVLFSSSLFAWNPTKEELRPLPMYCKTKANPSPNEVSRWESILGRANYGHVHHYCWGLVAINQSRNPPKGLTRTFLLGQAIREIEYSQRNASPDFILNPEMSVKKGKALAELGRTADAISEFHKAIKFKPDYAPVYAALFDFYIKIGLVSDAANALQLGLEQKPGSKSLNRRKIRLRDLRKKSTN